MIKSFAQLAPDARAAALAYLADVAPTIEAEYRDAVVCDLRSYLRDHLDADASPADVAALAEQAGPVADDTDAPADAPAGQRSRAWFGGPTAERFRASWWNPTDPRLLTPRVIGLGWDLNFGALAVRAGLIEPDAEDVPFESTPDAAFVAALAVPVVTTAALAAASVAVGRRLPATLPSHWDITGTPDRRSATGVVLAGNVALAAAPTLWAFGTVVGRRARGLRAGTTAFAATMASIAAAATTLSIAGAHDDRRRPWAAPALLTAAFVAPGAVLLGLARAGRAAEIRADLGGECS